MRILHINCNYIGTTLHQLMVEELDSLGLENEVFVPTYDKNIAVIKPNDNVQVAECFNKCDRLIFDYKQRKIIKAIEATYDISKFDLIHAYTLFTDGCVARFLSEKYKIPYVVAIRNTDVNDFLKKMVYLRRRGLKTLINAEAVFFLSNAYKEIVFSKYIPRRYYYIMQKVFVIPNGIDEFWFKNEFKNKKIDSNSKVIELIYAGGIDKNKNIEMTQSAMKLLHNFGITTHLTVIGKNKDERVYRKLIHDNAITVLPPVNKQQLMQLYRKADIFVMPSFTESFGLVYAEAMSQGLPIVYSAGQGFDGQYPEGIVGYSVNPHSAKSIAEAIQQILLNKSEISSRVVQCARKFNWKEIAKQYKSIYLRIGVSTKEI